MRYKIDKDEKHVFVEVQYNAELIKTFRHMKGKWVESKKKWRFPIQLEKTVENVILDFNDSLEIGDIHDEIEFLYERIDYLKSKLEVGVIDDLKD